MGCRSTVQRLPPVPGSVRTVVRTLCNEGPMTMKDIQTASGLARRTVYGALRRLRELGMAQERADLRDTRQTFFWLRGEGAGAA